MRIGGTFDVVSKTNVKAIPVPTTTVVYTRSFDLRKGLFFGLWVIGTATTNPDIKIETCFS